MNDELNDLDWLYVENKQDEEDTRTLEELRIEIEDLMKKRVLENEDFQLPF